MFALTELIGLAVIEEINQEPNFGSEGNYNLAEVKYKTTTDDMDAAILYLDNPTNKTYPYVNIWDSNSDYPNHVLGKILLDVEDQGKAYYIYPKDKKAYYLGKPADAFNVMRDLGLGITNDDLNKIPEGNL